MAKQNQTTQERQQESRGTEVARNTSGGGALSRRGQYSPFGLAVSPFEVFLANPFSLMRRMSEEMDRAFGEFSGSNGNTGLWTPAIEVSQRDGQYVIQAELAGLKPEDVKVEITEDGLAIEGERKFEREEDRGNVHRSERRYGAFYRFIPLPEGANAEQARAKFENGVLEIDVPVSKQESGRRQIPVEASSSSAGSSQSGTGSSQSGSGATSAGSGGASNKAA